MDVGCTGVGSGKSAALEVGRPGRVKLSLYGTPLKPQNVACTAHEDKGHKDPEVSGSMPGEQPWVRLVSEKVGRWLRARRKGYSEEGVQDPQTPWVSAPNVSSRLSKST